MEPALNLLFVVRPKKSKSDTDDGCCRLGVGREARRTQPGGVYEHGDVPCTRNKLMQQFEPLRCQFAGKDSDPGDISSRPVETRNETKPDWIIAVQENDRDRTNDRCVNNVLS